MALTFDNKLDRLCLQCIQAYRNKDLGDFNSRYDTMNKKFVEILNHLMDHYGTVNYENSKTVVGVVERLIMGEKLPINLKDPDLQDVWKKFGSYYSPMKRLLNKGV